MENLANKINPTISNLALIVKKYFKISLFVSLRLIVQRLIVNKDRTMMRATCQNRTVSIGRKGNIFYNDAITDGRVIYSIGSLCNWILIIKRAFNGLADEA